MKITNLNKYWKRVKEINALEGKYEKISDEELKEKTSEFRRELKNGKTLDDILVEAFAAVREASKRTTGMRHFDVQLTAGIALHGGEIAEQKTGEGKTLSATLALYLNALESKGAHLVTVNDYLAKRDVQWMGPIYHKLGMSVGLIQQRVDGDTGAFLFDPEQEENLRKVSRRDAYLADITYGQNSAFGFDYLFDNLAQDLSQIVQREHYYAIIDEVDNILIDEARTPHIVSGPAKRNPSFFQLFAKLVPELKEDEDFTVKVKERNVILTDEGLNRLEQMLKDRQHLDEKPDLYSEKYSHLLPYLHQSLNAQVLFRRDTEYIVEGDEVIIIDESTGRKMPGRRFSDGLHEAIEAKEGVAIKPESTTLATISLQNYFLKLYKKLAGMTGTAATEAEEFQKIYGLDVVVVPTNEPMIRKDMNDLLFNEETAKFNAVVEDVKKLHEAGRPVLIGTTSIEKSERLAEMLRRDGIEPQVLNAKHHEKEAKIIAQAGRYGAVTVATNMAGRGIDIMLGGNPEGLAKIFVEEGMETENAEKKARETCEEEQKKVLQLGGLHVIGTERHESRRIDNQLSGRAGRQGDPGSSQFYISCEDEVLRRFGGDTIKKLMKMLGGDKLDHGLISGAIRRAQTAAEGYNFDLRKYALEYDGVLNEQRKAVYSQRRKILEMKPEEVENSVKNLIKDFVSDTVKMYSGKNLDLEGILIGTSRIIPLFNPSAVRTLSLMGIVNVMGVTQKMDQLAQYETRASTVRELMKDDFFREGLLDFYMRELEFKLKGHKINQKEYEALSELITSKVNKNQDVVYSETLTEMVIVMQQLLITKIISNVLSQRSAETGGGFEELIKRLNNPQTEKEALNEIVADENLKKKMLDIYDGHVDKLVKDGTYRPEIGKSVKEDIREVMDKTQLPVSSIPVPGERKKEVIFAAEDYLRLLFIEKALKDSMVSDGADEKETAAILKEVFTPKEGELFPRMYECTEYLMETYPSKMKSFKKRVDSVSKQGLSGVKNKQISDTLKIEPGEEGIERFMTEKAYEELEMRGKEMGNVFYPLVRGVLLKVLDGHWINHLTELEGLREGIGLRGYGQKNPLVEYQREAHDMYTKMRESVKRNSLTGIYTFQVLKEVPKEPEKTENSKHF